MILLTQNHDCFISISKTGALKTKGTVNANYLFCCQVLTTNKVVLPLTQCLHCCVCHVNDYGTCYVGYLGRTQYSSLHVDTETHTKPYDYQTAVQYHTNMQGRLVL